jgi:hypothetical protein
MPASNGGSRGKTSNDANTKGKDGMTDNVEYLLNERQALLLAMRADVKEAQRAADIRAEMIEIIKAWHRGNLLPKHKAPLLNALYAKAFTLP